jgi:acetyl esterase/lipase
MVRPSTLWLMRRLVALMGLPGGRPDEKLVLTNGASVRLDRPAGGGEARPALLWLHGGGYIMGSPAVDDSVCRGFADLLGVTVAAAGYRLAPENPYPAALDDAYFALKWLAGLPAVDSARVAIGGESGGAGLAAALALRARDRGEIAPVLQVLAYPMLDDRSATEPGLDNPDHRLWNQQTNLFGWTCYLGGADPEVAVPARNHDLSGVAPAWIGVGTLDLFYDENVAYANSLADAGVPCQLEIVQGAFHAFDRLAPKAAISRAFFDSQCAALRKAFAAAAPGP